MFAHNINNHNTALRIIVAPLDWGLGHATRCIPILRVLQNAGVQVFIAAEGAVEEVLKKEFPAIFFLPLEGYHIRYSKNRRNFKWKLFSQFFKIRKTIKNEHNWLKLVVEEFQIDAVISDNRFGFYSDRVPSIFITHQLQIQTGHRFTDRLAQKINYRYIKKFSECWVPDSKENGYAGVLSHPGKYPSTVVKYMGLLSRLTSLHSEKKYDFLILISGPEPQRTLFEKSITEIIQKSNNRYRMAVVRGVPLADNVLKMTNAEVFDHLPANALNELMAASKTVICRSGYSTIMDLIATGKQAILIPTPAQNEQEYLAMYLQEKKLFKTIAQEKLTEAIFEIEPYPIVSKENSLNAFINNWLGTLSSRNKNSI